MLAILRRLPSPHLAAHIRVFESRCGVISGKAAVRPLVARPEQFIEFYLGDAYRVRSAAGLVRAAPKAVIVGVHTQRGDDLLLSGALHGFTIQFTPTGFEAMFGVAQDRLTDLAIPAADVIERDDINRLGAQLAEAGTFSNCVVLAEAWLTARLAQTNCRLNDPIAVASRLMAQAGGRVRIDALVSSSALSARQFERRFRTQVGTSPKRYARILRFSRALRLRHANPRTSWTTIAHETGFTDQAHMIHDIQALGGARPEAMMAALGPALD